MSSVTIGAVRAVHDSFNRRDWIGATLPMRTDLHFTDEARGFGMKGSAEYLDWALGWVSVFSDAAITDPGYIDTGSIVVARFLATGTNDGPLGPLPPTGLRVAMPVCEIWHFDREGKIEAGETYYDQLTILMQLGHAHMRAA
jgi:predicted ester cyclase